MRWFVRQSVKGGRYSVPNHYYKSITSDEVFNVISTDLNKNGNICETIDILFEYETNIEKKQKHEMIHNLKIIEILTKLKKKAKCDIDKLSKLIKHNKYKKNKILMKLGRTLMVIVHTNLLCGMKIQSILKSKMVLLSNRKRTMFK